MSKSNIDINISDEARLLCNAFGYSPKDQEQLFKVSKQISKSMKAFQQTYVSPFQGLQKLMSETCRLPSLENQKQILEINFPLLNKLTQLQVENSMLIKPIQQLVKQWNEVALVTFDGTLSYNNAYQQNISDMQLSFNTLSSALQKISISNKHVSVPEVLIPKGFVYEEIAHDSINIPSKVIHSSNAVKRLSFSDAIAIIGILIASLLWLISFNQTWKTSVQNQKNHEELIHLEQKQISLQREDARLIQQQIEAAKENTKYLISLLNELQDTDEEIDLPLPDVSSQSESDESDHSIEAVVPDDFDVP